MVISTESNEGRKTSACTSNPYAVFITNCLCPKKKKKKIDSIILEFLEFEIIPNSLDLLAFMPPNLFLANGKGFEIGLGSNPDLGTL